MKMKRILAIASLMTGMTFLASAQGPNTKLRPDETVLLYADSFDGNIDPVYGKKISSAGFEMVEDNKFTEPEAIDLKNGNIERTAGLARVDLYFPKKANGQMIVVCPGGGYRCTSTWNEGVYVAEWLLERGITVAVVKYRMPNGHYRIPLTDVQNAFRYCRSKAQEWGVDQIGVMGFSAGGHLAASTSTLWVDEITRPDFSVLIYPVITMEIGVTHKGTRERLIKESAVWNHHLADKYSLQKQVTRFTPKTFIALCSDDRVVPAENSLLYYNALIDLDVPVEMHIWPTGGHGWGFSAEKYVGKGKDPFAYARADFENSLDRWLKEVR